MEIADGHVVTIEYTLRNAKGEVVESSADRGAVTFKLGSDRMLPGLAKAMAGMRVGEVRKGVIPPGQLVPAEDAPKRELPLNEFPSEAHPKEGDRFQARNADGQPVVFEVCGVSDTHVMVRMFHPLQLEEIHYEVKVLAARKSNLPPPPPVDLPDMSDLIESE